MRGSADGVHPARARQRSAWSHHFRSASSSGLPALTTISPASPASASTAGHRLSKFKMRVISNLSQNKLCRWRNR